MTAPKIQSGTTARVAAWSDLSQPLPTALAVRAVRNMTLSIGLFGFIAGSMVGGLIAAFAILVRRGQHRHFRAVAARSENADG